jgi:dehydrogenase/reductase SDR family protein 12
MVCRNAERGEEARKKVVEETGNTKVEMHQLDMADSKGIKSYAERLVADNKPLHVIINNAGCMVHERTRNDLGIESNFAVNSFGEIPGVRRLLRSLLPPL